METTAIEKTTDRQLVPSFDMSSQNLPNLHTEGVVIPADLQAEYWTPADGEVIRGFVQAIETRQFPSYADASVMVPVKVVKLIAQKENGDMFNIINAGKRLVSVIEDAFNDNKIMPGTPVELAYLGKKKNKKNDMESGRWSVKPINVQAR